MIVSPSVVALPPAPHNGTDADGGKVARNGAGR